MSPEVTKSLFFLFLRPHPLPTQSPYFSPGRSDLLFAPRDMSRWGGGSLREEGLTPPFPLRTLVCFPEAGDPAGRPQESSQATLYYLWS